jgi:hypothetical protein
MLVLVAPPAEKLFFEGVILSEPGSPRRLGSLG